MTIFSKLYLVGKSQPVGQRTEEDFSALLSSCAKRIVLVGRKAYADRGVPDVKQRLVLQRRRSLSFAAVDPCDSEVLST